MDILWKLLNWYRICCEEKIAIWPHQTDLSRHLHLWSYLNQQIIWFSCRYQVKTYVWSFAHRWTIQVINDNELQGFNWEGKVQYKLIDKGRLTISTGPKSPVDWDCVRPDQRQEPSRDLLTVHIRKEEEEEEEEEHPPHHLMKSGLNYVDNLKNLL